jgi:hypothetical protein
MKKRSIVNTVPGGFVKDSYLHPNLIFAAKAGAYQSGVTRGEHLDLPANIRLGWK